MSSEPRQEDLIDKVPRGPGLAKREKKLTPAAQEVERKKRLPHYVLSPLVGLDFSGKPKEELPPLTLPAERSYLRYLSRDDVPRARVTVLVSDWYPGKDRSEAAFKENYEGPAIIALPIIAWHQAVMLKDNYCDRVGLDVLSSITGYDEDAVAAMESLILPTNIDSEDDALRAEAAALIATGDKFFAYLRDEAIVKIQRYSDKTYFPALKAMLQEYINIVAKANMLGDKHVQEQENALASAKASGKGKTSLDNFDHKMYEALGKPLPTDFRTAVNQPQQIVVQTNGDTLQMAGEVALLRADLAALKGEAAKQQQAIVERKPMKDCPKCANQIYQAAIFCMYCHQDVTE